MKRDGISRGYLGRPTMNPYLRTLPPFDVLVTFQSVGRHLNFTVAAREVCLTQGAVSKQMRQLEERIGVALFERQPRGVALTPAGQELLRCTGHTLEQMYQGVISVQLGSL
jgi:LysR family transcriptional regulator, glycine cleavage system transcriptional activator